MNNADKEEMNGIDKVPTQQDKMLLFLVLSLTLTHQDWCFDYYKTFFYSLKPINTILKELLINNFFKLTSLKIYAFIINLYTITHGIHELLSKKKKKKHNLSGQPSGDQCFQVQLN